MTELEELSARLAETEEMLRAISSGEVDALLIREEIHLLKGSAHPYRIIKEEVLPGLVMTEDGSLIFHNRLLARLLRLEDNGRVDSLVRFLAAPEAEKFQAALTAGLAGETHASLELSLADGAGLPVDVALYPMAIDGLAGCCIVVTGGAGVTELPEGVELRNAPSDTLDEMDELRYRMLADFVPHIVWTARPDGYRDYFNRRWYELTGLSLEESRGEGWADALPPEDRPVALAHWRTSTTAGQDFERELRLRTASGDYRWHLVRSVPVRDRSGKILKWFGVYTDIEEQKRAREAAANTERQLKEMTRELIRSNEALSQFANVASHDLQEPLHKISSYTDLLSASAAGLGEREKRFLQNIQNAALRMNRLIADILAYARVSARQALEDEVPLRDVVDQVLDDMETRVRETNAVVTVGELPTIAGSRSQMRQLFQNLLSNALKYAKEEVPPRVEIATRAAAEGLVEITVTDNGIGFDKAHQERIFRPFERLHARNKFSGHGFGLAVCRRIVEAHGGAISAESQPGVGSTFRVVLPLRRRP